MTDKPFIDIEFFPCAGGMGEGFRRAGVEFDLMIELEPDHCSSYEANLQHRPLCMDAHDFHKLIQTGMWRPQKRVRMLVADPPCTPWSRAGKREGELDPRDCLALTCKIIRELRPDVYLIGNVPGLDDHPNLSVVQRHIGALSEVGYCSADFARIDAANYGVPQNRIRPFWFGHLKGPCISWPEPTHADLSDMMDQMTLPGMRAMLPWVTCKQALGHLSAKDLGRPVRLRHRTQNSAQHGSVPEKTARGVGTSNLSDGNVILPEDAPRAGKRGRKRTPQANRTRDMDRPSAVITTKVARKGAGEHSTLTLHPTDESRPAKVITRNTHSDGSILVNEKHAPADLDSPSPTLGAKYRGQSGQVLVNNKHFPRTMDQPANTVRGGGELGHSAPPVVISTDKHPASSSDRPANTIRASDGEGSNRALEWPWERPATTVQRDERIAPPGHHDEYSIMSLPGAVVISEKAAAILQGFPETWVFVGKTKKQRWSQIGQAMPPPLAHAVATCVVQQIERTNKPIGSWYLVPKNPPSEGDQ